jgi:hypothetical protein
MKYNIGVLTGEGGRQVSHLGDRNQTSAAAIETHRPRGTDGRRVMFALPDGSEAQRIETGDTRAKIRWGGGGWFVFLSAIKSKQ